MRIYRREVGGPGGPGVWDIVGVTCFPEIAPGQGLSIEMVRRAFHDTRFARAVVSIQPVGGRTLVNLPTFVAVGWERSGFGPDEVDRTQLLGHAVDIRPRLEGVTYRFGDGAVVGPTMDLGGPYPDGLSHTYAARGSVTVRVDARFGGQFRVDGGEWIDIPDSVTVTGIPQQLEILESHARLYS